MARALVASFIDSRFRLSLPKGGKAKVNCDADGTLQGFECNRYGSQWVLCSMDEMPRICRPPQEPLLRQASQEAQALSKKNRVAQPICCIVV